MGLETQAPLRLEPGGSASPVTQRKAGGASRAPACSRHAHQPRKSAFLPRASWRDRDSGSPHVISQQQLLPMAIVMHLGGIFVSGGISEDLFVPPAPSGLLGGERQPSPTAMARHARGDALRSGPVGRRYPRRWLFGLDVRLTRRRGPCKAGKAVACLLLLYLYTYLEADLAASRWRALFLAPRTDLPRAGRRGRGRRSLHAPRPPPAPRGHPAVDLCGPRRPARGGTLVGCRSAPVVAVLKPAAYWVHRGLLGCNRGH